MVITLEDHTALTPLGRPTGRPIPVAPVVAIVMIGLIAAFKHTVGFEEGAAAVFSGKTLTGMTSGLP
jgi:hypothetical protein